MEIQKIDINKLIPATYNPRKDLKPNDEEYIKIKNSIINFGYVEPIIINKDFTVIGGHQRLKVLKELNYEKIECIVVDLDKTQEKALNIALNKISGEWNTEKLENLLQELLQENFDVNLTGFDSEEIDNILNEYLDTEEDEFDIDEAINEIQEPITKPGDIWILGRHRLMCRR
jgi:ParB-like chromosome segregation protein Spo0J|nr:MAG TPA: adenine specific DNA methyltransferase [Caudoviricetes sp.]